MYIKYAWLADTCIAWIMEVGHTFQNKWEISEITIFVKVMVCKFDNQIKKWRLCCL